MKRTRCVSAAASNGRARAVSAHTCIALFRGINVGRTRSLPMKDLVRILEGMGFEDIRTYIQSGNAVFRSESKLPPDCANAISNAVEHDFGFAPAVLLLDHEALLEADRRNPFPTDEGKFLHFFFLESEPGDPDLEALEALRAGSEQFRLDGKVFYLYTPGGFGKSKLAERAERSLGVAATARNYNTVAKLLEMAASG